MTSAITFIKHNQIKLEPGTQSDPFKSFDGYGQMPVQQMQDNMSNNMQMAQQQDFKMAMMQQQQAQQQQAQQQQQQQRANLNNPQQANQVRFHISSNSSTSNCNRFSFQLINAQRMMRPVMPNNNPGLRHLLQQQVSERGGELLVFVNNYKKTIAIIAATITKFSISTRYGYAESTRNGSSYGRSTAQSECSV